MTSADVAKSAGVSVATVSLVLNAKDRGRVLPETRERVLAIAENLGYEVDRRARGLATGRTGMVGFVAPDISNPFFGLVHMGMLREFGYDYQVLVVATEVGEDVARRNIRQLLAIGVDGLLVFAIDASLVTSLKPPCPVVLFESHTASGEYIRVNYDIERAATVVANHLAELGHRNVAYLDANTESRVFQILRRTFFSRMRVLCGPGTEVVFGSGVDTDMAIEQTLANAPNMLSNGITAIVCATDWQAYGALAALRKLGIPVPQRISVASFNDLPMSTVVTPQLTSVWFPAFEMGRIGAQQLRRAMAGNHRAHQTVIVDTILRRRESTGPAPNVHNADPRKTAKRLTKK